MHEGGYIKMQWWMVLRKFGVFHFPFQANTFFDTLLVMICRHHCHYSRLWIMRIIPIPSLPRLGSEILTKNDVYVVGTITAAPHTRADTYTYTQMYIERAGTLKSNQFIHLPRLLQQWMVREHDWEETSWIDTLKTSQIYRATSKGTSTSQTIAD